MVDDRGNKGMGAGEQAMEKIIQSERVQVIGVVAVSSNGKDCNGLKVNCSITKNGKVIEGGVDKYGNSIGENNICGDTLSVLKNLNAGVIVGIGDPGKMDGKDDPFSGAPITTMALDEILKRSGSPLV
jgi:stage V sporulation protein AE